MRWGWEAMREKVKRETATGEVEMEGDEGEIEK